MRISDWSSDVCSSDLGIPDVAGRERARYAGRRVLVIGGGHSAINAALALMELQGEAPGTEIFWALRRDSVQKLLGGGLNDQLPARSEEHTSELQSLMCISYAVFCLKKKKNTIQNTTTPM